MTREQHPIGSIDTTRPIPEIGFSTFLSNGVQWFIKLPEDHDWRNGHILDVPSLECATDDYTNCIRNLTLNIDAQGKPGIEYKSIKQIKNNLG